MWKTLMQTHLWNFSGGFFSHLPSSHRTHPRKLVPISHVKALEKRYLISGYERAHLCSNFEANWLYPLICVGQSANSLHWNFYLSGNKQTWAQKCFVNFVQKLRTQILSTQKQTNSRLISNVIHFKFPTVNSFLTQPCWKVFVRNPAIEQASLRVKMGK